MSESKKLIPRRRFKGFSKNWRIGKLAEIAKITMGQSPDGMYYTLDSNNHILVQGNADIQNGKIIPRIWTTQVTKIANIGDIIYTVRAPVGDLARTDYRVVLGRGVAGINGNDFIYQLLNKLKRDGFWNKYSSGSTFDSINYMDLSEALIKYPDLKEQTQIGEFFKKLDNLINTQQKKLEKAKTLKLAYLTEMFPNEGELKPKQRFSGFNNNWQVHLLKDLGNIYTGNTPSTMDKNNWATGEKGHVWVTPTDIKSLLISDSERYLTDIGWKKAKVLPKNSVLITSIASIGKNSINIVPLAFNQQINAIIPYKKNAYFILSAMEKEKKRFSQLAGHTSMAIINKTEFENFTLIIPHEQEQTKIGNFFKLLDDKIALEQKKLNKLKNIKQAYLNEMFV